jgi:hypothetical protein
MLTPLTSLPVLPEDAASTIRKAGLRSAVLDRSSLLALQAVRNRRRFAAAPLLLVFGLAAPLLAMRRSRSARLTLGAVGSEPTWFCEDKDAEWLCAALQPAPIVQPEGAAAAHDAPLHQPLGAEEAPAWPRPPAPFAAAAPASPAPAWAEQVVSPAPIPPRHLVSLPASEPIRTSIFVGPSSGLPSPVGQSVATTLAVMIGSDRVDRAGTVIIGTAPKADAAVHVAPTYDGTISRTHLSIEQANGGVRLTDLGSTNGTAVLRRGAVVPCPAWAPVDLEVGDVIAFGDGRAHVVQL